MAFIRGSTVTFGFLAHGCPFRPTQRAPYDWDSARFLWLVLPSRRYRKPLGRSTLTDKSIK